jgi:hypothetical protein
MDFRASYGEKITGESWVMRDLWQTTNMNYNTKLGFATCPKKLKSSGIKRIIERALWEQGIRQPLKEGKKRHEWKAAHGFRKFYKSRAEQVMKPINVELTMAAILSAIHSDKVNIVAHSKGGLDARWYIADNNIDKVANLIMIGTPNDGTTAAVPAAFGWDVLCPSGSEGLKDLLPSSDATRAVDRLQSTHYYTIAGYYSLAPNCYYPPFYWFSGNCFLGATNDELVTVGSVQCSPDHCYNSLEVFPYDHLGLLTHKDVYEKVLPILSCGRVMCGHTGGT